MSSAVQPRVGRVVPEGAQRAAVSTPDRRRWMTLACIALAQLMAALDATIVNIALPSAQRALHISDADRQWVVTAYTLAFGGLLLLGGRLADHLGRKRSFLLGLVGFAAASAMGGSAVNLSMLIAGRALQGAFAALLTPAALSLLAITFTGPRERATAFSVYGAIAGSGAAVGLLMGGVLAQYAAWRWCLFVNVPIAAVGAVGGWMLLSDAPPRGGRRFDVAGAALATAGLVALVYACAEAAARGWGSPTVIGLFLASGALLAGFVGREARAADPLLPLRVVLDRNRGGSYLAAAFAIAGMVGAFLFLTYYLQIVRGYAPLEAGLAFLPMTLASQVGSWAIARRLLPLVPARSLIVPGLLVAAAGMALLTRLQVGSDYATLVLPAEILLGLGIVCAMTPAFSTGTLGVDPRDAGIAAATLTTAQQVGGSVGAALLNTIATGATDAYLAAHAAGPSAVPQGLVNGYAAATAWGTGILALGAVLAAAMVSAGRPTGRGAT